VWAERCKQILKKWRALPNDKKAPYLTMARDNRAAVRMKKTQQVIVCIAEIRETNLNYRIYFYTLILQSKFMAERSAIIYWNNPCF